MWLRKTASVPAAAPGGYTWETLDDVVEVPNELGLELLEIPGAAFAEAPEPARKPRPKQEPEAPADTKEAPSDAEAEVVESPTAPPRKRAARKSAQPEITE